MTAGQAFSRIVRGHLWIVVVCLVVPLLLVIGVHRGSLTTYSSVSRVQVAADLAGSATEASAASARAAAIVTAPSVVTQAMAAGSSGLVEDPTVFATENIQVAGIGVSPIVAITVADTDAQSAQRVVTSLSAQLVMMLNTDALSNTQSALAIVDEEISKTQQQRDGVAKQLLTMPAGHSSPSLQAQLASLDAELGALRTQRSQLAVMTTQPPVARVVDPATTPDAPDPSGLLQRLGLALLFGVLLAIALAGAMESLRPRVTNAREAAEKLGVPYLGDLGSKAKRSLVGPSRRLSELADESNVHAIVVLSVRPVADTSAVGAAWQLANGGIDAVGESPVALAQFKAQAVGPRSPGAEAEAQGTSEPATPLRWRPESADDLSAASDPHAGFVLLVARRTRVSRLRELEDQLVVAGRPLLAVLGVRGPIALPPNPVEVNGPRGATSKSAPPSAVIDPQPVGTDTTSGADQENAGTKAGTSSPSMPASAQDHTDTIVLSETAVEGLVAVGTAKASNGSRSTATDRVPVPDRSDDNAGGSRGVPTGDVRVGASPNGKFDGSGGVPPGDGPQDLTVPLSSTPSENGSTNRGDASRFRARAGIETAPMAGGHVEVFVTGRPSSALTFDSSEAADGNPEPRVKSSGPSAAQSSERTRD